MVIRLELAANKLQERKGSVFLYIDSDTLVIDDQKYSCSVNFMSVRSFNHNL